jgi:hypothetical protein
MRADLRDAKRAKAKAVTAQFNEAVKRVGLGAFATDNKNPPRKVWVIPRPMYGPKRKGR